MNTKLLSVALWMSHCASKNHQNMKGGLNVVTEVEANEREQ